MLHTPVQMPIGNQTNHPPRMVHFQNHGSGFSNAVLNGNNQYTSGPIFGNTDSGAGGNSGGSGEHMSSNNINNDVPTLNMGGNACLSFYA